YAPTSGRAPALAMYVASSQPAGMLSRSKLCFRATSWIAVAMSAMTPAYTAAVEASLVAAAVVSLDLSTCTHAEQRRAEIASVFARSMDGFMSRLLELGKIAADRSRG